MKAEDEAEFRDYVAGRWTWLVQAAVLLTGDPWHAEDLAQTALERVFVSWSRVRAADDMDAYTMRILINQNKNRFRRRRVAEDLTAARRQTGAQAAARAATDTRFPVAPNAPLPSTPLLLGSGVLEGRHWSVSGVASAGNSAPTAKSTCLKLLISEDGRTPDPTLGVHILYCLPGVAEGYEVEDLPWEIKNGAGTLDVGTVSARVAKIVAHIDGVPAPVTVATVPAPGVPGTAIFIVPSSGEVSAHIVIDEYDAAGVEIGSWDNTKPLFTQ